MIEATGRLRSRERERLLKLRDVYAIIDAPRLEDLRRVRNAEQLHYVMRAWFTGAHTWVVYYRH